MVADGAAAVEAARAGGFDVILMDVRMPRMDGLEASRAIRGAPGPSASLPIIAVTADAMAKDDPEIRDAGVTSVLTKPVTLSSLAAALDAALRVDGQVEINAAADDRRRLRVS
jgi:CheY-like chemotaxis protein